MFDYLIGKVRIPDGSGGPAFPGTTAVSGRRIAAAGPLDRAGAAHVIDGRGRTLTPGFIDIRRHAGGALLRPGFGRAELTPGLTTIVSGNCGLSLAPVTAPTVGRAGNHRTYAPGGGRRRGGVCGDADDGPSPGDPGGNQPSESHRPPELAEDRAEDTENAGRPGGGAASPPSLWGFLPASENLCPSPERMDSAESCPQAHPPAGPDVRRTEHRTTSLKGAYPL